MRDRLNCWAYVFGYISHLPGLARELKELADDTGAPPEVRSLATELAQSLAVKL